jgi:hypothetical protein
MPMVPACMLTRSDCTKTASPYGNVERSGASATAENEKPSLAAAPGHQAEFGGRSIFSNTNAGLEMRRVRSLVSRFGCTRKSAGPVDRGFRSRAMGESW